MSEPLSIVGRVIRGGAEASVAAGQGLDTLLDRLVVPGYTRIGLGVRRRMPGWPADPAPDALRGKHILVTGASSGLGAANVEAFARLGATVHLLVRDPAKGAAVTERIVGTWHRPDERDEPLRVWTCDIGDLDSVRTCAAELIAAGIPVDGIVHNAGVLPPTRTESAQGHEVSMAVHVLGPVLLTEQLLPAMHHEARVVFVTSGGMYAQRLRADDPEFRHGTYSGTTAYARSKRAQVALLPILQDRWHGPKVYATHPGWAKSPGLGESLPGFSTVTAPVLRSAAAGADTTNWLIATEPAQPGGGLWHDRRERPTSYLSRTDPSDEERAVLWDWVRAATGVPPS